MARDIPLIYERGEFKPANLVTLSRGVLIAPIFGLLLTGHGRLALAAYVVAAATDLVDGWLARRFKQSSDYGAQLDAFVDNLFSLAILGFLLLAWPDLAARHGVALAVLFGGPVLYLGVSWLMTRRLLMFHVWSAKLGAVLLFCLWPAMAITGWDGWLVLSAVVVGFSRLEQIVYLARGGRDLNARHGFAPLQQR
jgi:phosphatidylglycerophosphate synthase